MSKSKVVFFLLCFLSVAVCMKGQDSEAKEEIKSAITDFFLKYKPKTKYADAPWIAKAESYSIDNRRRVLSINANARFSCQDFTESSVRKIYNKLSRSLPKPYNKYQIKIISNGLPIEELVAGAYSMDKILSNGWGDVEYDGKPWVDNYSMPYAPTHGLFNKHISLWASHGMYYDNKKRLWKWQRPNLYGTTEDLFTQTIVVPFLIPMLEKAGAVVFTPRERDWQPNAAIVDNDGDSQGEYNEENGSRKWNLSDKKGFAVGKGYYVDGENPFQCGTAKVAKATSKKNISSISYQPLIPEKGSYAVYVSYQTLPNSVDDAEYTVFHKGQKTTFHVNQQIGGSTWVYLGTFDFDEGCSHFNRVVLTNKSSMKGVITADAVRFGGGMGNIVRGGRRSGMPRCLEGARYNAQFAGVPYEIYSTKKSSDDYGDDINVRPLMSNWLGGGSVFMPSLDGKKVPVELSLAVHSDAGYSNVADSIVGSLAICTTKFNGGRLNSGVSRKYSKDFADSLLAGITRDVSFKFGKWNRRYLWDRNYSETRNPEVPSAIIETLSHQNFADMLRGHDPNFKFTIARSIYKTILKFVNNQHGRPSVVEPLTPNCFRIEPVEKNKVRLSWTAVKDPQEPTANPTSYILYTSFGETGFDNGTMVNSTSKTLELEPGIVYKFRVAALNRGGESFPSEVLAAYFSPNAAKTVVVINGFKRLSGPAVVDDGQRQGFDLSEDIGVSYGTTAGWNGYQQCFDVRRLGVEGPGGLGFCGNELAGKFICGNTFDYVADHAVAIASTSLYNVVSCSSEAVETGMVNLDGYDCVDLLLGLQKDDGHSLAYYKTFSPMMQKKLREYSLHGGRMFVSGAYVASDMSKADEKQFVSSVLKVKDCAVNNVLSDETVNGLGINFSILRSPNSKHYAAMSADCLTPLAPAYCAMQYEDGRSAAVAYDGSDFKAFVMGFPFECIKDANARNKTMAGILKFLTK